MNLPNKLTVGRFVLTGFFLVVFFARWPFADTIALLLFSAASITDYYDGEIARRRNLVTNFGILMDPLADKILVCSAFIAFVEERDMAAWMCVIIVARELAITGLRMLAASKNKVLAAERYGKHKTISQMIAIISILVVRSFPEWGAWTTPVFKWWAPYFATAWLWIAVILTAWSGALYLWKNRQFYLDDV
jgi:CDP-diacylglycerol---glycerol-3-phosphate 3-phosphatidyltransferase